MSSKFYQNIYRIFVGVVRGYYNMEIIGGENEPSDGAYIACSNHISNNDPIILAAALKRQVRFFAKAELFKIPLLKQLIIALGAFPVKRKERDVTAIKNTISILKGGEVIGFYPQGTRYPGRSPRGTPIKNGLGLIAMRTQATILPVSIYSRGFKVFPFKRTIVRIGRPIPFADLNMTEASQEEYARISGLVFEKVVELTEQTLAERAK